MFSLLVSPETFTLEKEYFSCRLIGELKKIKDKKEEENILVTHLQKHQATNDHNDRNREPRLGIFSSVKGGE